jgi:methionine-rich copper-binding protein CopC/ribosome biogenesis SPOUT family RNA methylase Rps3
VARSDGDPSAPPCDPANPDDPSNPCAVISVILGAASHYQTGFSAAAGDFNGDGLCDEAAIGGIGDSTRLTGFAGRTHVVSISDNENDGTSDLSDEDDDNDCLSDLDEDLNRDGIVDPGETDPLDLDTDADGLQDGTESGVGAVTLRGEVIFAGTDCSTIDPNTPQCCLDADNGNTTTDPLDPYSDTDSLVDGYGEDLDLNGAICGDTDLDGNPSPTDPNLPAGEIFCETDPNEADTDGDGLDDDVETLGGCPDPLDADSDDDGLDDGNDEGLSGTYGTDACLSDTDGDGLQDGTEVGIAAPVAGPNGVPDAGAGGDGTDPITFQPDLDIGTMTDPTDPDTDDDCLPDGCMGSIGPCPPTSTPILQGEDVNLNGQVDGVILIGVAGIGSSPTAGTETDPTLTDSDLDQLFDGLEWGVDAAACAALGTDPTGNQDADPASFTDPRDSDTDDGGIEDGAEDTSAGGNLNGAWDFDPTAFSCDPGGNPDLDTNNETNPGQTSDDRVGGVVRLPGPDFADPNNAVVTTYLQDDLLVVLLDDADENADPNLAETIALDPNNAMDPNTIGIQLGLTCFPDDPNSSSATLDLETIVLTETDLNTGLFLGTLPSSDALGGNGDGTLNCDYADRGRFAYRDDDDLCDQRIVEADVKLTQIQSVTPAQGSTSTTPLSSVEAVFDQDLDCAAATTADFTVTGSPSGPVAGGSVACDPDPALPQFGSRMLTLSFASPLPDDLYLASLDCDAPDPAIDDENGFQADCENPCIPPVPGDPNYCTGVLSGNGLPGGTFTWDILVDNDQSPTASAVSPADGEVLTADPTSVTVQFSEAMDPNSINIATFTVGSLTLPATCGSVTYDPNQMQATCTISAPPSFPDDQYIVTLVSDADPNNPSVRDLAGNALDGNDDGTTGDSFTYPFVVDKDSAPAVTANFPADGAVETAAPTAVTVDFEEPMDPTSLTPTTFTVEGEAGAILPDSVGIDPNNPLRATFTFAAGLPDDSYTVTLAGDPNAANPSVRDFAGNALDGEFPCSGCVAPAISGDGAEGGPYSFSFIVDAETPVVVVTNPACALTPPANPPIIVNTVTVDFSEAMEALRIDASTLRIEAQGDPSTVFNTDPNSVSYDASLRRATITPDLPLGNGAYQIAVDANVPATDVIDLNNNLLDGEVTGALPSGDGTPGGSFTCAFNVSDPNVTMRVSGIEPGLYATDPNISQVFTTTNQLPTSAGGVHRIRIRVSEEPQQGSVSDNTFYYEDSAGVKIPCEDQGFTDFDPPGPGNKCKNCNIRCIDDPPARTFLDDRYSVVARSDPGNASLRIKSKGAPATNYLDGEFPCPSCAPPDISGDGSAGGDFVYSFYFDNDQLPQVTGMTPAPATTVTAPTTSVVITFDQRMDPNTLDTSTFTVSGAVTGPVAGTVALSWDPNSPTFDPNSATDPNVITATFTGAAPLVDDTYTVTLDANAPAPVITDMSGNALDGEYPCSGCVAPAISGDGTAGGSFVATFTVDADQVPTVTAMVPAPSSLQMSAVTSVTVTFDQHMDASTIDPNTFTVVGSAPITPDSVTFDPNTDTATFAYAVGLPDDTYTVTLDANSPAPVIADLAGNVLDGEYPCVACTPPSISGEGTAGGSFVATFTIDTTAPRATGMTPAPASTQTSAVTAVAVTFDEDLDPATVDPTTFTVVGGVVGAITPDSVTFDAVTDTATFAYAAGFPDDTYTVTLDANAPAPVIADLAGNALDGEYPCSGCVPPAISGDGTAGGSFVATFTVDVDQVPTVTAMVPAPASTVAISTSTVDVTFDQQMDPNTLDTSTFTVAGSVLGPVIGTVSWSAATMTATFTAAAPLVDDTYTVTLDANAPAPVITDLAGNALDGEYPCSGCVPPAISGDGTAGGSFVATFTVDAIPLPTVTAMVPAPSSVQTSAVLAVTVTFDQHMDASAIDPNTFTVVGSVPITPDSVTFDPNTDTATFAYATGFPDDTYTVTLVGTGGSPITDLVGIALDGEYPCVGCTPPSISGDGTAGGDFVATFTIDTTAPRATGMTPAPASTQTSAVTAVAVTFDEDLNPATVDATAFTVVGGVVGTITPDSVTFDAVTDTATFAYAVGFPDDTYTVTLDANAPAPVITDLAGNVLDGEYPCVGCVPPAISGDGTAGGSFVATFTVDAIPIPPPPLSDITLDVESGGVLSWASVPVPPGGTGATYNLYRGDMVTLSAGGPYTQDPSQSSEALAACAIGGSSYDDGYSPAAGKAAFYLLAVVDGGVEGSLGTDSSGQPRPSTGLCGATGTASGTGTGGGSGTGNADVALKPAGGE